jgi:hypothetical protein
MGTTSCLFSLVVFGALIPSPVWHRDYGQALTRAQAAKKPVAVFIGSGAGGWKAVCEEAELSLEVRRLLADHYVCVYVDSSQPARESLVRDFEAGQLPLVVLSSQKRVFQAYRHSGKLGSASLAQALQRHATEDNLEAYDEPTAIGSAAEASPEPFVSAAPCRS